MDSRSLLFLAVCVLGGLTATSAAQAQENEDGPAGVIQSIGRPLYVAPMLSLTAPDGTRETKLGTGGMLAIGTRLFDSLAIEGVGYYNKFNDDDDFVTGAETEMVGYGGNLLWFPSRGSNFFAVLGALALDVTDHPALTGAGARTLADYDSTAYEAGLGWLSDMNLFGAPAAIRVEARYRHDAHDEPALGEGDEDSFSDAVINLGVMFPLFWSEPEVPEPEPTPVEVVPVAPPPADTDGDGVTDDLDQCPDTPAGTQVDDVGCPLPPPCESPAPGEPADLRGCKTGDVIVLHGVNFDFDKARLTVNAQTILDMTAEALNAAPNINVEVGGHTDSKGSDSYNQKLSERRAQSVVDYLASKGVDGARMHATGYGETRPVADNETDEGRELNRRVELTVE